MSGRGAITILVLVTSLAYASLALGGYAFLVSWDDGVNIVQNPALRGDSLEVWRAAWRTEVLGVYEPLGLILKGAIVRLFGVEVRAFQLATLALHASNACLLFLLARRLLALGRDALGTGLRPELGGLLAALLFALHPMRVEVVAWASGQSYALAASFFLLSLLSYVAYAARREGRGTRRGIDPLLACSIAAYTAAVLSKSSAIFLPAVLLLLDFFPLRRKLSIRLFSEKAPFFLIGLGLGWAALRANAEGQELAAIQLDLPARAAYAIHAMIFHLSKTLWPTGLHPHYALVQPDVTPFSGGMWVYTAIFAALCSLAWTARRAAPWLTVAWLFYVAGMLPVSGLVGHGQWTLGADRYTYMPLVGVWTAAGGVLTSLRLVPDGGSRSPARVGVAAFVAIVLVGWSVSTYRQLQHWRNDETLWSATLATDPDNALALGNLGYLKLQQQDLEAAIPLLARASQLEPWNLRTGLNLGIAYQKIGRHRQAIRVYERALEHHADEASLHNNLGVAYARLGRRAKAREHTDRARQLGDMQQVP